MIGEIGGTAEEEAANWAKDNFKANRIIHRWLCCTSWKTHGSRRCNYLRGKGTAADKFAALEAAGIKTTTDPAELAVTLKKAMDEF